MYQFVRNITDSIKPLHDSIFGPTYRCSLTLKDGTFLPCVVLQSRGRLVELAKRRIQEEISGQGRIGGNDPYGQIVSTFAASGNRVADYDVHSATESKFAVPHSLLARIDGETTMGWTGWVFRMKDGTLFPYGSGFGMSFLSLPNDYDFTDVVDVINHSFVDADGSIIPLQRGGHLPDNYPWDSVLRERVFFICSVDGL